TVPPLSFIYHRHCRGRPFLRHLFTMTNPASPELATIEHFQQQAHAGRSINCEFDHLPRDQQLQIIKEVRAVKSADPAALPDLTLSGGSGTRSNGWHLRSTNNQADSCTEDSKPQVSRAGFT